MNKIQRMSLACKGMKWRNSPPSIYIWICSLNLLLKVGLGARGLRGDRILWRIWAREEDEIWDLGKGLTVPLLQYTAGKVQRVWHPAEKKSTTAKYNANQGERYRMN